MCVAYGVRRVCVWRCAVTMCVALCVSRLAVSMCVALCVSRCAVTMYVCVTPLGSYRIVSWNQGGRNLFKKRLLRWGQLLKKTFTGGGSRYIISDYCKYFLIKHITYKACKLTVVTVFLSYSTSHYCSRGRVDGFTRPNGVLVATKLRGIA